MIITCDACGTSFKVKSSLIKETGSTVRCSKCQYLFIAYPPSAESVTPIELMSDENIETSIDDTFGKEADEKYLSDFFGEEDQAVEAESKPEPSESLRDLEAEIDADMSALSAEITEDLFDETQMRFDGPGQESGEPEILLSDLEAETEDVIELDALAEPEADDIVDIGSLVRTAEEEEEDIFFDDLESEGEDERISSDTVDAEEELDFESLEMAESDMDETVIIEDFEIGKDGVAQPDFTDFEDLETDEGVISLETVDDEEDMDDDGIEMAAMEETTGTAEYADVETDTKGGVEAQLDEFEAEKEPEGEEPSKQDAEVTGKKEPEEALPAEDKAADAEDVELDFDPDDTVALEKTTETAEFELDFEADLDEALAEEKIADAEDVAIDFDQDETVALETSAITDEFDLNLEEEEDLGETASDTQDLELDFESDLDEALEALETEADAQDLNLDLDETEALETAGLDDDFDLDFEGESKVSSPTEESEDIGLDLDLDAFDLDLETVEGEDAGEDEFDLGLEPEDIDLKTQLYDVDETAEADAEDETFDLDLELEAEDEPADQGDDFVLDLDIEPEAKPDKEADEFELDFEEVIEEPGVVATKEILDFGEEEAAPSKKTSEELDLSEIEDFLDFGDDEEETQLAEPSESMDRVAEMEGDALDMDMDLDFETVTAPEEEAVAAEIDIDLETMIDEEIGMEKEVSLETTEEREQRITDEYRKKAEDVPQRQKEVEEFEVEEAMEADVTAVAVPPVPVRERGERLKPILVIILVLLLSGVLIYAGIKFFSAPKEVPVVVDPTGKLQIEMIRNPEYAFVVNDIAGELFVVTGHVTNQYDQPRSHIQVKATVYDAAGKVVVTSGAYCGNMLSDSDLSALDLETINRRLANPEGDANANVGVKPGARVPFTVVFSNLPENIDEMTVEVVASIP